MCLLSDLQVAGRRRLWRPAFLSLLACLVALATAMPLHADVLPAGQICADIAREFERAERIPPGLIHTVSLAESGRWSKATGASTPWPWTVTSGRESYYLASKSEAIAKVEELQARGRSNIDVGCMQINLRYHPDAFDNLEAALDPRTNIAYGTGFLKQLRLETRSWGRATAAYHSRHRDRGNAYRDRVYDLWRALPKPRPEVRSAGIQPTRSAGGVKPQGAVKRPAREPGALALTPAFAPKKVLELRRPTPATPRPLFSKQRLKPWSRERRRVLRGG